MAEGPPSKKRGAARQITKDDDPDSDEAVQETGTFKVASSEVLAQRKIIKVKRTTASTTAEQAPSSNPFAGLQLVPPPAAPASSVALKSEEQIEEKTEQNEEKKEQSEEKKEHSEEQKADQKEQNAEEKESNDDKPAVNGIAATSSTNAFGSFGTGTSFAISFGISSSSSTTSASSFTFGSSSSSTSLGLGSFAAGKTAEGGFSSLFGAASESGPGSIAATGTGQDASSAPTTATVSLREVPTETGEEQEKSLFTGDATLFEFVEKSWKERGKGELKLNSNEEEKTARLLMRSRGNFKLLLNAGIFPDMRLNKMDAKSVTFACVNSAGKNDTALTTYAVKLRDVAKMSDFISLVEAYRGKAGAAATAAASAVAVADPKVSEDDKGKEPAQAEES